MLVLFGVGLVGRLAVAGGEATADLPSACCSASRDSGDGCERALGNAGRVLRLDESLSDRPCRFWV